MCAGGRAGISGHLEDGIDPLASDGEQTSDALPRGTATISMAIAYKDCVINNAKEVILTRAPDALNSAHAGELVLKGGLLGLLHVVQKPVGGGITPEGPIVGTK